MNSYIDVFNQYIAENRSTIRCSKVESLLDMLYCCYHQQKSVDAPAVKAYFSQLDQVLDSLPIQLADQVVDLACDLCGEHQKQAFREGILVGFCLYTELHQLDTAYRK